MMLWFPLGLKVLSASLQVSGSFTCMAVLHKFGKRSVAMFSMTCCALCCVSLGVYKLLQQTHYVNYSWIPLLLVSALFYLGNVGISPIPWSLLAEVFPSRGRGIGGGISAASYYVLFFLVSKTFLDLEHCFQLYGVFFLYGALGFVGLVFLYFCLPETEGKKLDEIEKYFKGVTKSG